MTDLEMSIYVAIRTAPRRVRSKLASRLPTESDAAADSLAVLVAAALERYDIKPIERRQDWHKTF